MEGDMGPAPQVVQDGKEEVLWFFGTLLLLKATAEQTGGRFCLCEQHCRRGMVTPLHRQPADEETFVVLEGELRFYLDDEAPIRAGPGTTVHVPAGAPHAFAVASETARFLDLTTPTTRHSSGPLASRRASECC